MKRLKGQQQKACAIKRQKSQTGDYKHVSDNLQQDSRFASDKHQQDSQLAAVKFQQDGQLAPDNLQQDSELAVGNLQQSRLENKKTGTRRENGISQTLSVKQNFLETDAEKVEQDTNADTCVCTLPDSFKSNYTESSMKLPAGFGFTPETCQYRTTKESKQTKNTSSSKRQCSGQCVRKNVDSKKIGITSIDGNVSAASSSLIMKGVSNVIPVSTDDQVALPKDTNNDIDISDSKSESQFDRIKTERLFKTQKLGTQHSVEMDVIYTKDLQEEMLEHAPEQVPDDYVDMSPRQLPTQHKTIYFCMIHTGKQKPDQESNIVIPHKNADKPEGDDFGAKLWTFIEKKRDGSVYHRHLLVHVVPTEPAGQMRIEDNDELVLVNDVFVPVLTHTEVLNIFHHVQVDGKTRLLLVVRRVKTKKKWSWIETSAILTADKSPDEGPVVEYPEYKRFKGERYEMPKSKHIYKVPGTQKYLDISDRGICVDILQNDSPDKTKVIWKRCIYKLVDNEGHIDFAAALSDETMMWYIGINQRTNDIILKNKPEWFKMITSGSNIRFQFKDQYLGYDRESGQVKAQTSNCVFEELPASELQARDTSECVPENISETTSRSTTNMIHGGSIASNDDSDNSETSFSQSSEDSISSSQESNTSERNAVRFNDGAHSRSSGYSSRSLTPPDSLDTSTSEDYPDSSRIYSQCGSENNLKTTTTPLQSLSLTEKTMFTED
ncbi:uncharacterized protein LOC128558592 isoform X2 [Mercenaria mercenaria]|uniref:uncharacterized protein LOC128558592 isoform X2 n=1 Tax=Mercenaria mercenaria TaxID=6596 RepID=UPI00234F1C60|nr:uncharacterized protein LOC128558592 isoform X2 [Mercenaria mercenaria]